MPPKTLILCAMVVIFAVPAPATIIATTGNLVSIAPPVSVKMSGTGLKGDSTIWAFDELQGFRLNADLMVNIATPGTYGLGNETLTPGTIAAGRLVNSHFIHYQPESSSYQNASGSITFDQDILGLIVLSAFVDSDANLDDTDALLGAATTVYPTGEKDYRGAELDAGGEDELTWLGTDPRTLTIDKLHAKFPGDQIRVITAAVPEPTSVCRMGHVHRGVGPVGVAKKAKRLPPNSPTEMTRPQGRDYAR